MEELISFLKVNKIDGRDFALTEELYQRSLIFAPDTKTKLAAVEKIAKDFSLFVSSVGVASVTPLYGEGKIKISWLHTPMTSMLLPIRPSFYCVPLGITANGSHRNIYLPKAPHILVAGTTGSGKTYWMNGAIKWALKQEMEVFAIDPKWGEFAQYVGKNKFIHLTSDQQVLTAINDLAERMEVRYRKMAELGSADIIKLNETSGKKMDPIVLVVDELADLIGRHGPAFLAPLQRIAQKGRAAGIHIVCATQTPTAKLLNGELKANFPVRVAFRTASATASRVILDSSGAENLSGQGDGICISESGEHLRFRGYIMGSASVEVQSKSIWQMLKQRSQT
jgi:DNA segregation ATPase FtsK/SpoIIIE-like protein